MLTSSAIQRTRGALGLTQRQFAELVHCHHNTVCRWEMGILCPDDWQTKLIVELAKTARSMPAHALDLLPSLIESQGPIAALGLLLPTPNPPTKTTPELES